MNPVITINNKKYIQALSLPKGITFEKENSLYKLVIHPVFGTLLNKKAIIEAIIKTQCMIHCGDGYFMLLSCEMEVEKDIYFNTYRFYIDTKEEVEITSYEQGIAVLKDLFPKK